jgi:hypothetical protein
MKIGATDDSNQSDIKKWENLVMRPAGLFSISRQPGRKRKYYTILFSRIDYWSGTDKML